MSILHWNCRGYRANFEELKTLIMHQRGPACICLQESFHGTKTPLPPRGYEILSGVPVTSTDTTSRPSRGLLTLIKRGTPYSVITPTTDLEALTVRIKLSREYTICNLYISPTEEININSINELVSQLPRPFLILGDMNARSQTWGDSTGNPHGRVFEELLVSSEISLLNNNSPTHFHLQTASSSNIDLSLLSNDAINSFSWEAADDSYGSDHFPIILDELHPSNPPTSNLPKKFNTNKADWNKFYCETSIHPQTYNQITNIDELVDLFNNLIINAATASIPRYNPNPKYPVPWWSEECKQAHKTRKTARRKYQRTKSPIDKIALNRASAIARYTKRQARKQSWQNYISSINSETPIQKIWKRVNKISQKFKPSTTPCIKIGGNPILDKTDVSNALGEHWARTSSNSFYSPDFNSLRERTEITRLNFNSNNTEHYNSAITMNEINSFLQDCRNTAPGNDQIEYQMLKKMAPSAKALLHHIFNKIFTQQAFPKIWTESILIPILKPDKPRDAPISYRPIALTSSVCKLLEKIVNNRLITTSKTTASSLLTNMVSARTAAQ